MAHSSLLTPVPTNNEEATASANGDGVVLTVHLADKFTGDTERFW